ncbi:coenzyme F420-0:L-glutamate ligase [Candidatus Acetothermia bacterium]|jgi:F420-0:gamma-glutamyl ligase|nr:coenzyme F420-0:L-glutamate ligase [Candidatus Acetothermia bacterium]
MSRAVGVKVWGIRAPVVREGDNLQEIVTESFKAAIKSENIRVQDNDVLAVTESLVARAQGNYVTLDDIAQEINEKYSDEIAVVFPILSRNRFSIILKAIARDAKHVHLFLNYPSDEVGNQLMDQDILEESGINPYTDLLTEEKYRNLFGETILHPFTGIDYVGLYKEMASNGNISVYLSNNPKSVLEVTDEILCADIHSRHRTKRLFKKAGAKTVYGLDDLCTKPSADKGYNPEYGLLGSNKATEEKIKLFPRDGQRFVDNLHKILNSVTGKNIEVMIYGDGAFKDPVSKIWELADPVVSPAFTKGLSGLPNELKLKFLADDLLKGLSGSELNQAMKNEIMMKPKDLVGNMASEGTTPRRLTDLLGSLSDLTSGSGDKGTPIVFIQGYFDNYATE